MLKYISLFLFSLFFMLVLFVLIWLNNRKIINALKKQKELLNIYSNIAKIEQTYITCKYNGEFENKNALKDYLYGITSLLDSSMKFDKLRFEKVAAKQSIDILEEYMNSNDNVKKLFEHYQKQMNHMYEVLHPVKYRIDRFKKKCIVANFETICQNLSCSNWIL